MLELSIIAISLRMAAGAFCLARASAVRSPSVFFGRPPGFATVPAPNRPSPFLWITCDMNFTLQMRQALVNGVQENRAWRRWPTLAIRIKAARARCQLHPSSRRHAARGFSGTPVTGESQVAILHFLPLPDHPPRRSEASVGSSGSPVPGLRWGIIRYGPRFVRQ